jgi:hypothetical protein
MAYVYYRLIKSGARTMNQVPAHLREEVQALLAADVSEGDQK